MVLPDNWGIDSSLIVLFNEAHRRIPVQYGRSIFRGGDVQAKRRILYTITNKFSWYDTPNLRILYCLSTRDYRYLFASKVVLLEYARMLVTLFTLHHHVLGTSVHIGAIFTFFYALVVFNQQQLAENLQRNGGFVLGIRPGKPTQDYLNRVIVRITWGEPYFLVSLL
ncbi:MAG: hypothetical protein Ct9H300mP27_11740 [Chloroflexota bacterium]|nr:MAG: hypothetical protein Ct9H300mP27_11740 [Chloroflexota bacterium]